MFDSKYSKVLTVILVVVVIAIIGLLAFLGYEYYQNFMVTKDTSEYVDNFQGEVQDDTQDDENNTTTSDDANAFEGLKDTQVKTAGKQTYKGFGVMGTIEIPAINLKYPILEKVTKKSIETAVAFLYGTGINQPGNSVIIGHNYRNGMFFSNNKKLKIGDKIFITDTEGKQVAYTIYSKFETSDTDTSFYQRDTGGKPEITLSTCTDDSKARLIICGRVEE